MMKERRHFSDEPKAEAVKMVARDGLTHAEVARRLGVPKGSIGNWIATFKEDTLAAWPGADLHHQAQRVVRIPGASIGAGGTNQ
jgi:transposase-like protein